MFSDAYVQHLKSGPFAGRIDPWAEVGRYFHPIHSGMIDHILGQIQDPLMKMGYLVGRETSLQVTEGRLPDLLVQQVPAVEDSGVWDYAAAATAVMAEPGELAEEPDLEAIHLTDLRTGELVTVLEIISPTNKKQIDLIEEYQERRQRLFIKQHVSVVEIDATRSLKRLLEHKRTFWYPYHTAVFMPHAVPRVIGSVFEEPLKRFALPLHHEVVPVEPQAAYDHAYQRAGIAAHILTDNHYEDTQLPFPSTLTADQRQQAIQAVQKWQEELERLAKTNGDSDANGQ